jgi:hypothetical protein
LRNLRTKLAVICSVAILITGVVHAQSNLSPEALACFKQAVESNVFFKMNKQYKSADAVEKLAIGLCTYSDALGSLRCYQQADQDSQVLNTTKMVSSNLVLEQQYARLCSNSRKNSVNASTGDADAIDCFKMARYNNDLLKYAKEYMVNQEIEDLVTKLCISSNGLGVKTCYLNSLKNSDEILKSNKNYKGPAALDQLIVDLCKGSRLRP